MTRQDGSQGSAGNTELCACPSLLNGNEEQCHSGLLAALPGPQRKGMLEAELHGRRQPMKQIERDTEVLAQAALVCSIT